MMKEFSILDTRLEGTNLIEASAGTGKTYTISMIYLRLVVENELPVENILVVTFTIPATAELRTRIRQCVKNALDYLEHGVVTDDTVKAIIDKNRINPGLRERLHSALRSFDEASVFTIHSFCQQVLTDNAFESGSPFRTEINTDDRRPGLAVADYWRRASYSLPDHAASVLMSELGADRLLKLYRKKPMSPDYGLEPEVDPAHMNDVEDAYAAVCACYDELCGTWKKESERVRQLYTDSLERKVLSGTKYKPNYINSLAEYIQHGDPLMWNDRVEKFTSRSLEEGVNKGKEPPVSLFFDALQEMKENIDSYNDTVRRCRITVIKELFRSADNEIAAAAASSDQRGFDDLIRGVYTGLKSETGERLGLKVRSRYRAALIDEFQDTDSMQFAIFSTMFGKETSLFLIGDPKQAIYRFRGADIFSYMKAAEMADARYTLARNWRSTPGLIAAVNHIFGGCTRPFVFDRIGFSPVKPGIEGQGHDLLYCGRPLPPMVLELVDYEAEENERMPDRDDILASGLAAAINSMLTEDYAIDGKRLRPSDIAVLVRTNKQASIVKTALSAAGIPAVTRSAESVFASDEAAQLFFIFSAILYPSDQRRFRTALATEICGCTAEQVARMASSADTGESDESMEVSARFHSYREAWNRGFMDMFIRFMEGESVASRLFSCRGGGRSMANIQHIAELMDNESTAMKLTPADTLAWLASCISSIPEGDEYSMRLETDDEAVNVMTMHSSKGLEFPVVFCPFLASSPQQTGREDALVYHDDKAGGRTSLYIEKPFPEEVSGRRKEEDASETARLIYVALTRAKSYCNVMMKITPRFGNTQLADLLFRSRNSLAVSAEDEIDRPEVSRLLKMISESSNGTIGFAEGREFITQMQYTKPSPSPDLLQAREFRGNVSQRWRMYSYSAIASAMHDADEKADENETAPYRPEHGVLPPGAASGLCLHEIFENSDFTWSGNEQFRPVVDSALKKYGFGAEYLDKAISMVLNVLSSPLDNDGLKLSLIRNEHRLSELEFHFPVGSLAGLVKFISGPDFAELSHGIDSAGIPAIAGMMKGYIDLVFMHKDRYFIVDWKSNMLDLTHTDYSRESILAEMKKHNYHLQYHIYTAALHRYLRLRLGKHYDYDRHFGGVYYLFIRGMNGKDKTGVFSSRPELRVIERLDGIFRGDE